MTQNIFDGVVTMTKPEYTNMRDLTYNKWHRKIGSALYASDVDFIEYSGNGDPLALIETKRWGNSVTEFQRKCFLKTANPLKIPFFCVQYTQDLKKFFVESLNEYAKKYVSTDKELTEKEWIGILYKLHKIKITEAGLEKLVAEINGDNKSW